jgi:hypothetical protein
MADVEALRVALDRLHQATGGGVTGPVYCRYDGFVWPCPERQLLDAVVVTSPEVPEIDPAIPKVADEMGMTRRL